MKNKSRAKAMMTTDREGHPWRAYPDGYLLCATHRPYHKAYDADNNETDGKCDCVNRSGVTIATFTIPVDWEGA